MSSIPDPIGLSSWLALNSDNLKPPVNAMYLYSGKDFILMAVGGPNTRNDYHITSSDRHRYQEWFYQIKGDMVLKVVENNDFRDIVIHQGESFLLPANTPHSPRRSEDTIGLVMERTRPPQMIDRVRWYCGNTEAHGGIPTIIREESFYCADIETQLKEVIDNWMEDENSRRCGSCGVISPAH
ncbi:hypothetical protein F1880_000269 [Penicillium rolfsii]|nr:hypothetical protein F1880_000269 [Penicillium rolfsii]